MAILKKAEFEQAIQELEIYQRYRVDAAIVEDYFGSVSDVYATLDEIKKHDFSFPIGMNMLSWSDDFERVFSLAQLRNIPFVQFDNVYGNYKGVKPIDEKAYAQSKQLSPEVVVLGGVWFKGYHPVNESTLEHDLLQGSQRAESIVVTGEGTAIETPLEKIKTFRSYLPGHPLIVGAGVTVDNIYAQLNVADGAIIGSAFKEKGVTHNKVDHFRVHDIMQVALQLREYAKDE